MVYVPGLGVGTGSSRLSRYIDIIGGGAFGWGLKQNLESAVFQLAMNFEPGDEIFIFGYSRGAYTAFLLSWFANVCGIPPRNELRSIPEMVEHFAKAERGSRGNSVKDFEFRARNSPLVSTTLEEQRWRQERDLGPSSLITIRYLGVWDMVSAVGLPFSDRFMWGQFRHKFSAFDGLLPLSLRAARHAVALDEERVLFEPVLWENPAELNSSAYGERSDYRQVWFPGNHGVIGGAVRLDDQSMSSLLWVLEGAQESGLSFDVEPLVELLRLTGFLSSIAPKVPITRTKKILRNITHRHRKRPRSLEELSPEAFQALITRPWDSTGKPYNF